MIKCLIITNSFNLFFIIKFYKVSQPVIFKFFKCDEIFYESPDLKTHRSEMSKGRFLIMKMDFFPLLVTDVNHVFSLESCPSTWWEQDGSRICTNTCCSTIVGSTRSCRRAHCRQSSVTLRTRVPTPTTAKQPGFLLVLIKVISLVEKKKKTTWKAVEISSKLSEQFLRNGQKNHLINTEKRLTKIKFKKKSRIMRNLISSPFWTHSKATVSP
jgi:hypothetical protein